MASGGLILLLAGVAAVGFLWLYRPARALSATIPSATYLEQNRGVQLRQVNLCADNDGETGKSIDIIAIHGLDTKSPETWEYRTPDGQKVNWLQDRHMLPAEVSNARIFTCNWPAELLETLDSDQDTLEELALLLLAGVQGRPPATNDRPILFIASCLGGIILTKALVTAKSEYLPVRNATRGIIFLATPFRGTSFEDVARWAEPGLRAWASIQGRQVTRLLDWVKSPAFDLIRLVGEFTQLCDNGNGKGYKVLTFYETQYTNLPAKIPFLSFLFSPSKKQLVDKSSAVLDCVPNPLRLNRTHVLMNKFRGPKDSDPDYKLVVDQIRHCLEEIRKGTPLERADAWIREKHYTQERLKIERLSGDLLSMDQCYINLALVETQRADRSKDTPEERALRPSPFSLSDRLKIKTPHENIQVKLEALFDLRKMPDGHIKPPRRILIRGRAGIGKTTLCKKIVYDFTHGTLWHDKFDRLLWIPLRNLKREARTNVPGYSMGHLFLHEYFSSPGATDLINALWIETHSEKTLFILDGLDEISSDLRDDMFQFLKELLNQPNIILTSRPHAVLPSGLKPLDLELETIGFYPQQVGEYIRACCKMTTANGIETFLQGRQLIRDLVRIPIQLDALCFTWDGLNAGPSLQTMTEFYMAIEERLWKKDVVKLGKLHEGQIPNLRPRDVIDLVDDELKFLEALAFTGMHTETIEFEPKHRDAVFNHFINKRILLLDATVAALSFLRTSDSLSQPKNQQYHFLHLTFQEYFAARYFVRHWNTNKPLKCLMFSQDSVKDILPVWFLQEHKYNSHYNIMWRFVVGLLDEGKKAARFFEEIEKEPVDLLGPTHQRLVMHCLSEAVSLPNEFRRNRENRLTEWVLFESDFTGSSTFARESELPERVLQDVLAASRNKRPILDGLAYSGKYLSETNVASLLEFLKDKDWNIPVSAAAALGKQSTLSDTTFTVLVGLLKDKDNGVRNYAASALGNQSTLSETTSTAIVELFKDEDSDVRRSAASALGMQLMLSETTITALLELLKDSDNGVRRSVAFVLGKQSTLSDTTFTALMELLKDKDNDVRGYAASALGNQSTLSETTIIVLVKLLNDDDSYIRRSAAEALGNHSTLSETTTTALIELLDDEDSYVQGSAASALGSQSTLSETTTTALVELFKHKNSYTRLSAASALGHQSTLSETITTALVELLDDKDKYVRRSAASALSNQSTLSETTTTALVGLFKHKDSYARSSAASALGMQLVLSETTITALLELFNDENSDVRRSAVEALGTRLTLSEKTATALNELLDDEDSDVRGSAAFALGNQLMSETTMIALAELLDDEDSYVRRSAAEALGNHSTLSETTTTALIELLDDEDSDVRGYAASALGNQSTLLETTTTALVELLDDEDIEVRRSATEALGNHSMLSETTTTALVGLLRHKDSYARSSAASALGMQLMLSETTITALLELFNNENSDAKSSAIEALGTQSNLMCRVLEALGLLIRSESQACFQASVFHHSRHIEFLYGSLLRQSFEKPFSLYSVDNQCTINEPSGLRTATLENGELLQDAVSNGRHGLRNISSYKLWGPFEEDEPQSSAASTLENQSKR